MSTKMKVAYVVKRYPRYSETFIVNEILEHEKANVEIEVFALRPPSDTHFQSDISKVKAAVNYLSGPGRTNEFWNYIKEAATKFPNLWKTLEENTHLDSRTIYHGVQLANKFIEKGITHAHSHFATSAAEVTGVASQLTGIPFSITAHAKDIFHETVIADVLNLTLSRAQTVVTVSDYNVNFLNSILKKDVNLKRIYNGMDLGKFEYSDPAGRKPLIISVGRLVEKKGFCDLIDACAILRDRDFDFTCQIIGSGDLQQDLAAQIENLKLGDFVELSGPKPQIEIVNLLKEAQVFAAPCVIGSDGNKDGMPTVLLEAMASGLPCVSTPVTGIPELVIHNETGLIVDSHNSAMLADALELIMTDDSLRDRISISARKHIEQSFNVENSASQLREIFHSDVGSNIGELEISDAPLTGVFDG